MASPATRVQATQSRLRAQCWAHWAALWVWGITWSESALKLTKPLEYWRVFGAAHVHSKTSAHCRALGCSSPVGTGSSVISHQSCATNAFGKLLKANCRRSDWHCTVGKVMQWRHTC